MKWLVGIIAVLLLAVVGMPLLGYLSMLPFALLERIGDWFSPAYFSDGQRAFRTGLVLGGAVSVLSLLWVAAKDTSATYLWSAVGVSIVLLLLGVTTAPESPAQVAERNARWARAQRVESPAATARPSWAAHLDQSERRIGEIATASARGQDARVQALWEEMAAAAAQRPSRRRDATRYNAARSQYLEQRRAMAGQRDVEALFARREALRGMVEADPAADGALQELAHMELTEMRLALIGRRAPEQADELAGILSGRSPEALLDSARTLLLQALAVNPERRPLWGSYAITLVDSDAEAALGAMILSLPPADDSFAQLAAAQLDLSMFAYPRATRDRWRILRARAELAHASARGADVEARTRESAEEVLPAAGWLEEGTGLRRHGPASRVPDGRRAGSDPGVQVEVDFVQAGIVESTRRLPETPRTHPGRYPLTLALDVAPSGDVVEVLVETSSGDMALDTAARAAGLSWRFAASEAGARRRVEVVFTGAETTPTVAADLHSSRAAGGGHGLLEKMVRDAMRTNPPRYPPAAVREGIEGTVLLDIEVAGNGEIERIVVAESSGHPLLDDAAVRAARRWRVHPGAATSDVDVVRMRVPVDFRMY
ncbi:TonB family protein [Luteimonas sp. BDR2-5]|uniref:TonB family protein n=1 Tax=Proluteimonas luteida TaxID=2878685 RepID=UPI001E2D47FF|nr:TonB family protein [Luteimonas sp. BDR2-5]MCD9028141.1 TonB family protein [Luteimonas sp. BDR2-5]